MVLLFRFVLTIWLSRFRKRIGPLDEAVVWFRVLPNDCDLNIHLNAGRFVSFMDIARVELLARMRVLKTVINRGWRPIVGGGLIRYRRSIEPFERFSIRSRVLGWDDKWFYIEHVIENHNGELCAVGTMRTLLRGGGRSIEPRELLALMNMAETPSPELPDYVEQWRRAEDAR